MLLPSLNKVFTHLLTYLLTNLTEQNPCTKLEQQRTTNLIHQNDHHLKKDNSYSLIGVYFVTLYFNDQKFVLFIDDILKIILLSLGMYIRMITALKSLIGV